MAKLTRHASRANPFDIQYGVAPLYLQSAFVLPTPPSVPNIRYTNSAKSPIRRLPSEILERVGEYCNARDSRQVQLAWRSFAAATRRPYLSKNFAHRHLLLYSPKELNMAIELAKHPEFGKAITTLSLFMDATVSDTKKGIPRLRDLFALLKQNGQDIELVITDRQSSSWRPVGERRADWEAPLQYWRTTPHQYWPERASFTHSDVRDELNVAGLSIASYAFRGGWTHGNSVLFSSRETEISKWEHSMIRMKSFSIGRLPGQYMDCGLLSVLDRLPMLQSLCLMGGSFSDLGRHCFAHLKELKIGKWNIDLEEMIAFLKRQPVLEHIDLGEAQWGAGMGVVSADIAKQGESLDEMIERLTGVKKITATQQAKRWVARVIESRLGRSGGEAQI